MNIEELKTAVSEVLQSEGCGGEIYFVTRQDESETEVLSVDMEQKDTDDLVEIFIQSLSDEILVNDDLSVLSLSGADDRSNVLYQYDLEVVPEELSHLQSVLEESSFDSFSFNSGSVDGLKGIIVLIGNEERQIALYKVHYPVTLVKKAGTFNLARFKQTDRLRRIESDIVRIGSSFEFFRLDDKYYILNLKTLERSFGFYDAIMNVAREGLEMIDKTGLVSDISVLSKSMDDISFARKLVKSASASPVAGKIDNEQIVAFSQSHPALRGKFKYTEDGTQFDLSTKVAQKMFLKLLNDDYLRSELTDFHYESVAKDQAGTGDV